MMTAKSQQFVNELAQFYRNKGQHNVTSDNLIVRLNGKPVNLYELYSSVIEMGGSFKVNQYNRWDEIYLKLFNPQPLASNVSVALRQIYQKYLIAYERVNFSNFMSDALDNDDDDGTNKEINSTFSFLSNNNHLTLNQHQHLSNINPLNKLFCSLTSDLPNEMDFGLRVACILTNSENFDNLADFKFIDVIIDCCILYICSCERNDYSKSDDYSFEEDETISSLIREELQNQRNKSEINNSFQLDEQQKENICERIMTNRSVSTKFDVNNVRKFVPFKDCNCFVKFWCELIRDQKLMKTIFDLTDTEIDQLYEEKYCQQEHQKNYYKIKRIVCLLKNISYSIEKLRQEQQTYDLDECERMFHGNADNASINLLRFFILLLNSDDQFLINIALEIISNISPLVNSNLPSLDQNTFIKLLGTVYEWCVQKVLNSSDVNCLNRCLEILSKLINSSHLSINRLIISEVVNQSSFFNRLTELLTCQHDVGVVVSTLECCLVLSENYPKQLLQDNKHLIKMLINLINCEELQFFTESSIKKIKINDERKIENHLQITTLNQPIYQQQIFIQQPIQQSAINYPSNLYSNQVNNQRMITSNELNINNNNTVIQVDNNMICEQHVKNWLYTNYEPRPMNLIRSNETDLKLNKIYNSYVKDSCMNGMRNVVTAAAFPNLIEKYFPSVVINRNRNTVDGLVVKTNQINNAINVHVNKSSIFNNTIQVVNSNLISTNNDGNLASPILQAHLSTPPKSKSTTNVSNQIINSSSIINSSNQTQQIINGPIIATTSTTASPLIKNLLANKLRNNQTNLNSTNLDETKSTSTTTTNNSIQQSNASTSNFIFATNPSNAQQQVLHTTQNGVSGSNLITVPLQQHFIPISSPNNSNVIINTNQYTNTTGTMVVQSNPASGQSQQLYLVGTILPQQQNNSNIARNKNTNQQPMRILFPASMLTTSQAPLQSISAGNNLSINGTPTTSNTPNVSSSNIPNVSTTITTTSQSSNDNQSTNEKDKLLKACLGSTSNAVTKSPIINDINTEQQQQQQQQQVKSISNSVKSSPLLNVLLDKGKLPEFSTVSNDLNAQDNAAKPAISLTAISNQTPIQTQQIVQTTSNQLINNHLPYSSSFSSSTSSTLTTTATASNTVACKVASTLISTTQIITPTTVNTNQQQAGKMVHYILANKSSLPVKNGNNIQTTPTSTPITSFIIQPINTTATVNNNGQQQFILQQNPTIVNSTLVSQPFIVQQQSPSNVITTVSSISSNSSVSNNNQQPQENKLPNINNLSNNNIGNEEISISKTIFNSIEPSSKNIDQQVTVSSNCEIKKENGELKPEEVINYEPKKSNSIKLPTLEEKPQILTNGCLEKENACKDEEMQIDDESKETKSTLLKRQLESSDSAIKKAKTDTQINIVSPIQTSQIINQDQMNKTVFIATNKSPNETAQIQIAVSSNGVLPNRPTVTNTIIKSALNSPISTCTIDKIAISKPTVIIQNNNDHSKQSPPNQIISTNKTTNLVKAIHSGAPVQTIIPVVSKIQYICEWANCKKGFEKPQNVFLHVHKDHISQLDSQAIKCQWDGPEGTGPGCKALRPKYSLLTHLQDYHCGVNQLQQAARRTQQLRTKGMTDVPKIIPQAHPGYAKNAAYMAIKRHSSNIIENRPITHLSPLIKSIRLTAAMILRNLAQHSNPIKKLLKNYETYLSELCIFDNREDSRTIAQCLAIISQERN